jgi:hypothetical protein
MSIDLAPRLNLITGDNGVGKSFLLDLAWWLLTRTWSGEPIRPTRGRPFGTPGVKGTKVPASPRVAFAIDKATRGRSSYEIAFDRSKQEWSRIAGRPASPGLVLYARVDGGFCVWDPARNSGGDTASRGGEGVQPPPAFVFDTHSIWNGLKGPGDAVLCKGLLQDWVEWQTTGDEAFEQLKRVLAHLSPGEGDVALRPGAPTRVSLGDVRDVPTLAMPYGDVPILHASAAMRRVAALAYLLVWAFREHSRAREFLGKNPEKRIIFLIDEIEAHLHPRWQRAILPAMLDVTAELAPKAAVQILATTHSPFVPLSVETRVDDAHDALWELDLAGRAVTLTRRPWERRGDAAAWATSSAFDLPTTRSLDGEKVQRDLEALYLRAQRDPEAVTDAELNAIDRALRESLPELDPIFARWGAFKERIREARSASKR